ncbi:MAG: HNH endonuclease, partial [Prevotella sp.]|nr:HNH endonuclease [Prevotella sp.]
NLYTHKIGNLCILTRKKNSAFSNLDFEDKKLRYFYGKIDTMPRTLHIVNNHSTWLPSDLERNQHTVLEDIREVFEIHDVVSEFDDVKYFTYVEKARAEFSNAYKPWTEQEEAQLLRLYYNKTSIDDICNMMGRNKGGITSRLSKLGVLLPDGENTFEG